MGRVYMHVVIVVLSVVLALLLLHEHVQFLLYYLLFALTIAAIVFTLRTRISPLILPEPSEEETSENKKRIQRWKGPMLMLIMSISVIVLPLVFCHHSENIFR